MNIVPFIIQKVVSDQGCSDKEILEACGVSAAFAGGAAMSQAVTLVQECLTELKNQKH